MKKVLTAISLFFSVIFGKAHKHAKTVVDYVNLIKNVVNSKDLSALILFTPTETDDEILKKIKANITGIMFEILNGEKIIGNFESNEAVIVRFIEYLSGKTSNAKRRFWVDLAGMLLVAVSDGKITYAESVEITQRIFAKFLNK